MLHGPQSSEAEHPHQLFSVRKFIVVQRGLSQSVGSLSAVAMSRWWSSSGAERLGASQVSKEPQAEGLHSLHPTGDWQAPGDTPDCLVGGVPGVWNSHNFPQTPGVKSIEKRWSMSRKGTHGVLIIQ